MDTKQFRLAITVFLGVVLVAGLWLMYHQTHQQSAPVCANPAANFGCAH